MKRKTKEIVLSAVFAAIVAALSQVAIPLPVGVSVTLQTFAVSLLGFSLSPSFSFLSVLVYVVLGALGIPVFANFKGGVGVLFGPSGGFIFGFFALALLCSVANRVKNKSLKVVFGALGVIVCHIFGVVMFSFVMEKGIWTSVKLVSLPFIIKDMISVFGAYCVKDKLKNILKQGENDENKTV